MPLKPLALLGSGSALQAEPAIFEGWRALPLLLVLLGSFALLCETARGALPTAIPGHKLGTLHQLHKSHPVLGTRWLEGKHILARQGTQCISLTWDTTIHQMTDDTHLTLHIRDDSGRYGTTVAKTFTTSDAAGPCTDLTLQYSPRCRRFFLAATLQTAQFVNIFVWTIEPRSLYPRLVLSFLDNQDYALLDEKADLKSGRIRRGLPLRFTDLPFQPRSHMNGDPYMFWVWSNREGRFKPGSWHRTRDW